MRGGTGNDLYYIDNTEDTVTEVSGEGTDEIRSTVTYALANNVETLTLTGTAAIDGTGNELGNAIVGNDAANVLVGGAGDDTLNGFGDDDTLVGGAGADTLNGGPGNDTAVYSSSPAGVTVSLLSNTGSGGDAQGDMLSAIEKLKGSAFDDTLSGDAGANRLSGGTGSDTIYGGSGDDFIEGDDNPFGEPFWTTGKDGNDELYGGAGNDVIGGGPGDDAIYGGNGDDRLFGGYNGNLTAGTDTLYGGSGNDYLGEGTFMAGGPGNDIYDFLWGGGAVVETLGEGVDEVRIGGSYVLPANVENLTLITGPEGYVNPADGTGNELANVLTGNSEANVLSGLAGNDTLKGLGGNDTFDGGTGADAMAGGLGDDVFVIDNAGDAVTEAAGEGADSVSASITYALAANVENLTLIGAAAINGTGNAAGNALTGNVTGNVLTGLARNDTLNGLAGNDTLDGGAGADAMAGGAGNDVYVVDNSADAITEAAGEGIDEVRSSIAYALGANVENLTLSGTAAINGYGNDAANVLSGNGGNNELWGQEGDDTLISLGGNDILHGNTGADAMAGGAGNDVYYVENAGDTATEASNAGTDLVYAALSYTLGANFENLTLLGADALNGTGNAQANLITGNDADNVLAGLAGADTLNGGAGGNDTLDGGAGEDKMAGGTGNDVYLVDNAGDTVTENTSAGTDEVRSSLTYTLGANVENLTLTGTAGIHGTGSAPANVLTGNSAANVLNQNHDVAGAAIDPLTHYRNWGWAEGRDPNPNVNLAAVDGLEYIASYSDLMAAFGADNAAGYQHFATQGLFEGRTTSFDGLEYIASYGDLINAFHNQVAVSPTPNTGRRICSMPRSTSPTTPTCRQRSAPIRMQPPCTTSLSATSKGERTITYYELRDALGGLRNGKRRIWEHLRGHAAGE